MMFSVRVALIIVAVSVSISTSAEIPTDLEEWAQKLPWTPKWIPCDYEKQPGASCQDCSTRLICTRVGGFLKPCFGLLRTNCNNGLCTDTPSEVCASTEEPPTTVEPSLVELEN